MGVTSGFSCFISYKPENVVLKHDTFKYVVIDAYSLICRYVIGSLNSKTFIVDKFGKKTAEIYFVFIIALRFLDNGIVPIFVFDGSPPHIKVDTIKKRRVVKEKASNLLKEYFGNNNSEKLIDHCTEKLTDRSLDNTPKNMKMENEQDDMKDESNNDSYENLDTYIKYLKRSFRLNTHNIEYAKLLLRWMGLPVVNAPGEADPQCAAIATEYKHSVIGVITDDFDALMYKSVNILKLPNLGSSFIHEYSREHTIEHIKNKIMAIIQSSSDPQITNMYMSIDLQNLKLSHDNLLELGCLMGTDFCPGLKVKPILNLSRFDTILNMYIKNGMSMDSVLYSMRGTLSKTYISRMLSARDAYKSAKIFDPKKMDISFKKPCIPMIKKICANIIAGDDLENAMMSIELAYKKYETSMRDHCPRSVDKFTSFASCRDRYIRGKGLNQYNLCESVLNNGTGGQITHRKQFPEPRYRIPITISG